MEEGGKEEREKQTVDFSKPLLPDDNFHHHLSEWVLSEHTKWMTEKSDRQDRRGDAPDGGLRMNKSSLQRVVPSPISCSAEGMQQEKYSGNVLHHLDTHYGERVQLMTRHVFIQPFIMVELCDHFPAGFPLSLCL